MNRTLLPLTKLVLVVSAVVQLAFGVGAFLRPFWNGFVMPAPLDPAPTLVLQYFGALFLANSLGTFVALREGEWPVARLYLLIAGTFVGMSVILTLLAAITPPGIPPILWGYVVLAALYLPQVVWVMRLQSARGKPAPAYTH